MTPQAENKKRWAQALIHCVVVLLVFVVPEMLITYLQPPRPATYYLGVYGRTIGILLVFYINYLWLIPATLARRPRKVWLFTCINILLALVFVALMFILMRHMPHRHRHPHPEADGLPWRLMVKMLPMLVRDFMAIVLAIGLSVTLKLTEYWSFLERKNEEILAAQRTEEIINLRSQLSPHSIFNTLNTIYALIDINTEQAKKAVHRLSKLLRYVLYENPSTVELDKEVEFIRSYVALMEMRLGEGRTSLNIDLQGAETAKVAPLLFLPIIENAFKHTATPSPFSPIRISLMVKENTIVCTTENPYQASSEKTAPGIGIENLRRRLRLIYSNHACLDIHSDGTTFRATLTIPLTYADE